MIFLPWRGKWGSVGARDGSTIIAVLDAVSGACGEALDECPGKPFWTGTKGP